MVRDTVIISSGHRTREMGAEILTLLQLSCWCVVIESCMCCMRMTEASTQVDTAAVGKLLGTFADFFENITQYDGVLVQGRVAQEGEAISAAGRTLIGAALRTCTQHSPLWAGLSSSSLTNWPVPRQLVYTLRAVSSPVTISHMQIV